MKTIAKLFTFGFLMLVLASLMENGFNKHITLSVAMVGGSSILLGIIKGVCL